jgi:hypothetical protein
MKIVVSRASESAGLFFGEECLRPLGWRGAPLGDHSLLSLCLGLLQVDRRFSLLPYERTNPCRAVPRLSPQVCRIDQSLKSFNRYRVFLEVRTRSWLRSESPNKTRVMPPEITVATCMTSATPMNVPPAADVIPPRAENQQDDS